MLERPRFKPHLRVEVVAGEGAFVLAGGTQTLLRGRLYERVVPWIGADRSADDVCDAARRTGFAGRSLLRHLSARAERISVRAGAARL